MSWVKPTRASPFSATAMVRKARVAAVTAVALLAVGYAVRQPVIPPVLAAPLRMLCGSERWSVKTFADADRFKVDLSRRYRTIKQLNALVRPPNRPQNARVTGE